MKFKNFPITKGAYYDIKGLEEAQNRVAAFCDSVDVKSINTVIQDSRGQPTLMVIIVWYEDKLE